MIRKRDKAFKIERGSNLIEIVVFIIVMAIIGVVILSTFSRALKGAGIITPETIATKTATTCMEYFLGQRIAKGYTASTLNCSGFTTPSFCGSSGISATCQNDISASGTCQGNCKIITVTVTGTGKAQATLSMLIANY
jgi:type II secretory pathway pseudopilin PulG